MWSWNIKQLSDPWGERSPKLFWFPKNLSPCYFARFYSPFNTSFNLTTQAFNFFWKNTTLLFPHHRQISGSHFSVTPSSAATCSQSESKNVSHSVTPRSLDCSLSGPSVLHGILQERILKWVAIPFTRGSSQGTESRFPALQADSLPSEVPGKAQFPLCTYLLQISLSKHFSPRSQGKEYCAQ